MTEIISDISRQRIATLYPGLQPLAYQILNSVYQSFDHPMNIVEAMRSMDEQYALYQKGRVFADGVWKLVDSRVIVTNARPGLSFHNYGLAFDCAFAGVDPYMDQFKRIDREKIWASYGALIKAHGLTWGGDFRLKNGLIDHPHAEYTYGLKISECFELYSQGGIKQVWSTIDKIREVPIGEGWQCCQNLV